MVSTVWHGFVHGRCVRSVVMIEAISLSTASPQGSPRLTVRKHSPIGYSPPGFARYRRSPYTGCSVT